MQVSQHDDTVRLRCYCSRRQHRCKDRQTCRLQFAPVSRFSVAALDIALCRMCKHADSAQLESLRVQPHTMAVSMFVYASTVDAEYTLQVRHVRIVSGRWQKLTAFKKEESCNHRIVLLDRLDLRCPKDTLICRAW